MAVEKRCPARSFGTGRGLRACAGADVEAIYWSQSDCLYRTRAMNLPQKIYTEKEVAQVKNTAQVVGWAQGAGTVVVAAVAWNLLGWIPVLLVLGGVAWVLYKLLQGREGSTEG